MLLSVLAQLFSRWHECALWHICDSDGLKQTTVSAHRAGRMVLSFKTHIDIIRELQKALDKWDSCRLTLFLLINVHIYFKSYNDAEKCFMNYTDCYFSKRTSY